jgi:hypothetical protein
MSTKLDNLIQSMWVTSEDSGWTPRLDQLAKADVLTWMKSDDIEILGYTHSVLEDGRFRVSPPLTAAQYTEFALRYFARCLKENPTGEWAATRYEAGSCLVGLFVHLWDDKTVPRNLLSTIKKWLEQHYREGDGDLRLAIIHATLEHIFEKKAIRKFFSDWKDDPVLGAGYAEACLWDRDTLTFRKEFARKMKLARSKGLR